MLKIENTETYGWEAAVRGMRNAMNSWKKSDSEWKPVDIDDTIFDFEYVLGENDLKLAKKLAKAGTDHRKYLRMITVYCDITAPLYWWKEFDTYKVGTVANSCSTMHKIQAKEFVMDDFSHEHLIVDVSNRSSIGILRLTVQVLNDYRYKYLETKDKKYWWQMIQLLPSSYNQKRTVMLNYEVLSNIYKSRKGHRLDEWKTMLDWIETLPYSELITGKE